MNRQLQDELQQRRQQGAYRKALVSQGAQGVHGYTDGREVLSFCSNDYLGLANHPQIRQSLIDAVDRYGVGSGSAHLVNGHSQLHQDCEAMLADFCGRDRALLFSTGYLANLAVAQALCGRHDHIFQDKLNHASLIDAATLSRASLKRYRHNDMQQLSNLLERSREQAPGARRLIMSDAVFSMDGDLADANGLTGLAEQSDSWLMLDDAHGFGVLGASGAGYCELNNLSQDQAPVLMATLGKAVGVSGAFVAGSETLIETLIQKARSYIYTTASPPALAAAVMTSVDIIRRDSWLRDKLYELIDYFKRKMQALDVELMPSATAIQPIILGDNRRALEISRQLLERGIHVTAIRPPTVPEGSARLRITLSAAHQRADIDRLLAALAQSLASS